MDGGVGQRLFGLSTAVPPEKKSKIVTSIETLGVCSSPTQKQGDRHSKISDGTKQALVHGISGVNTTVVCLLKDK